MGTSNTLQFHAIGYHERRKLCVFGANLRRTLCRRGGGREWTIGNVNQAKKTVQKYIGVETSYFLSRVTT